MAGVPGRLLDHVQQYPSQVAVCERGPGAGCIEVPLSSDLTGYGGLLGLVLDPYFSAPKMAWLRRTLTTEGVVTTTDTWLVWHLTGEYVTDASTASRSLLTGLDTGEWDPELLSLFELGDERLPAIVASDRIVGVTQEFGRPTPVAGLILDQQAALAAQGCLEAGTAKCTFGTGAFLLANSGRRAARSASGLTTSVAWRARGHTLYCLDGQVYTAASAIRWIQELGLIETAADLDRAAAVDGDGTLCSLALATEARLRGTDLRLDHQVRSVDDDGEVTTLHCDTADVRARWVINAAGLGCD